MNQLALTEAVPLAHALVSCVARGHDVRVMFIKGPAAIEQGLRSPGRASVDVDVFVDPHRLESLRDRLTRLGWVDENPYSTPTAATYSRTHRHAAWPCELDLHTTFPGFFAPEQEVFEQLWQRRASVRVAAVDVPCLDPQAHSLLLALNSLRDPYDEMKTVELADLIRRVVATFDADALHGLSSLAHSLGASDTVAPFLTGVGIQNDWLGSTDSDDLHRWRLRTQPTWRVGTWLEGLRERPLWSWPRYLWQALVLSEQEIRVAHPGLPPGRRVVWEIRRARIRRGLAALPGAVRSLAAAARGADRN